MDFGAHGHTFPSEISMRIDLLCHTVCIYLTLVDNAKLFPKVYYQFTGSPEVFEQNHWVISSPTFAIVGYFNFNWLILKLVWEHRRP